MLWLNGKHVPPTVLAIVGKISQDLIALAVADCQASREKECKIAYLRRELAELKSQVERLEEAMTTVLPSN